MTSVFQLYGRPLAEDDQLPPMPLMIVGSLPSYEPGNSYEGRLDVLNAIGKCTAEIVESSLPPGAYVFMDNFTQEVVLAWPTYTPPTTEASAIPNGDFEAGDDGSWRKGAGWTIEAGGAESGTYSGVFANQRGISSIESARVPYNGETITASARFQQGASSEGNLVGHIILIWCDADGNMIPGGEGVSFNGGNTIRSGSNGAWHTSSVTAKSNSPNAKTVAVGFSANRKRQNRLARVDNFTWNHQYTLGTETLEDHFLKVKVTDSANRVAYWSGRVLFDSYWLNTQVYPQYRTEAYRVSGLFIEASTREGLHSTSTSEFYEVSYLFVGASTRGTQITQEQAPEAISVAGLFVEASLRGVMLSTTAEPELYEISYLFVEASTLHVVNETEQLENMTVTQLFIEASTQ